MALHTLGTNATTSLVALKFYDGSAILDVDLGNLNAALASDQWAAAPGTPTAPQVPDAMTPAGIIATGTTAASTSVTAVTSVAGAPLAAIRQGMTVLGAGIPSGAFVAGFSGTTLTLSVAATTSLAGTYLLIIPPDATAEVGRNRLLFVPKRGVLKIRPGDVVARDNTGWPILLSGASVNYAGSQWTYT